MGFTVCGWTRLYSSTNEFAYRRRGRGHRAIGVIVPRTGCYTLLYGVVEQHADAFFEGQGERGDADRRTASALSTDPGFNLLNAIRTAASADAPGIGVLTV